MPRRSVPRRWEATFLKLVEFKELHGHTNVSRHNPIYKALGQWVNQQRAKHSRKQRGESTGLLSSAQEEMLESIGFCWRVGQGNYSREQGAAQFRSDFEKVLNFKNQHGRFPNEEDDAELSAWIKEQQEEYKSKEEGRPSELNDEQHTMLKSVGLDEHFKKEEKRRLAKAHRQLGEDTTAARLASTHQLKLDRDLFALRQGAWDRYVVEEDRQAALACRSYRELQMGPTKPASPDSSLLSKTQLARLQALRDSLHQETNTQVAGSFVASDRRTKEEMPRTSPTSPLASSRLPEAIDTAPRPNSLSLIAAAAAEVKSADLSCENAASRAKSRASWDERYQQLFEFKRTHGHCNVSLRDKDYKSLGRWVNEQRSLYNQGDNEKGDGKSALSAERISKLNAIGFCWKVGRGNRSISFETISDWETGYRKLCEYQHENGHCIVPRHFGETRALGFWVSEQRRHFVAYKHGMPSELTGRQAYLLESIGFGASAFPATTLTPPPLPRLPPSHLGGLGLGLPGVPTPSERELSLLHGSQSDLDYYDYRLRALRAARLGGY